MIISPPFLPVRAAAQTEEAWLDAAMAQPPSRLPDSEALEGSFPLSHNLSWHNGIHIQATADPGGYLAARAIADGEIVFVHPPTTLNQDIAHGQNYNPFDRPGAKTAAWTDNGCVVIKHTTEIGASATAGTQISYYSLYMHLSELAKIAPTPGQPRRALRKGDAIWRKDEIGKPGRIYGHAGQIHVEISLDETNLRKLIGRPPNWVEPVKAPAALPAPTADGRIDSIFGSLYFYLPASTPADAGNSLPASHVHRAGGTTLGTAMWVRMTYEKGSCTFESFDETGAALRAMPMEPDAEYNLYKTANDRHNALPQADKARSSPSGWYELLRFGRNIGWGAAANEKDPLPANAAHWRRVMGPNRQAVWADLNAPGSFKFSDADFLTVMGWNCVQDDDSPNDQRCDSTNLKKLICDPDLANAERMKTGELSRRLGDKGVAAKLRRTICKFPGEWDKTTIAQRYGFVKELPGFKQSEDAWGRFVGHLEATSFDGLPKEFNEAQWRVHPREFVGYMRQCGWLSEKELRQLVPMKVVRGQGSGMRGPFFLENVLGGGALIAKHHYSLNVACRKYLIMPPKRLAAFVANSMQETAWWSSTKEGNGDASRYAPWYGRGFLQLTNPDGAFSSKGNYWKYFEYRGRTVTGASTSVISKWRDDVAELPFDATDSAGAYWAWTKANIEADVIAPNSRRNITLAANSQLMPNRAFPIYENVPFRRVACLINLPGAMNSPDPQLNGLVDRYAGYANAQIVLFDTQEFPGAGGLAFKSVPEHFSPRRP